MDFSQLKKLDPAAVPTDHGDESVFVAIVKVKQENYHPPGLTMRQQISPFIFTADIPRVNFKAVAQDVLVEQLSLSKPLYTY